MKKTNKLLIILSWILVILILIMIFNFSSQDSSTSNKVTEDFIQDTIGGIGGGEVLEKIEKTYSWDDFVVFIRKIGHSLEYAALGFSLFNALYLTFNLKKYLLLFITIGSTFVVAGCDEIYQSFSDRHGNFWDVCLDTVGAFVGALIILGMYTLLERIIKKRKLKKEKMIGE